MHHPKLTGLAGMITLALVFTAGAAETAVRITVDTDHPGHAVQPAASTACFFEDINYGADGGLYAELVSESFV